MLVLGLLAGACDDDSGTQAPVVDDDRVRVATITVTPLEVTAPIDSTFQLTAEVRAVDGELLIDTVVTWYASNEQVAVVSPLGLVTTIDSGRAEIWAEADSIVSDSCIVTVLAPIPIDTMVTLAEDLPVDFPVITDQLTGRPLSGWGGTGTVARRPVVFIHGNGTNANSWITLANYMLEHDYAPSELWALSYLDYLGGDSTNSHWFNLEEMQSFISAVLTYTGSEQIDLICHSLGVTMGRAWMKTYTGYPQVEHFVGIAGANHGVAFCTNDTLKSICREIGHPQSAFLAWLNDTDETPRDDLVKYMTIYDGTGADVFYPAQTTMSDGSTMDLRESPLLDGALNVQFAGYNHGRFLTSPAAMDTIISFLQSRGK